eukprot:m.398410 g.398410  ORF g.398410 m.398410 type:complete len:105 (+) comp16774_c1_seq2:694-1008(+)
MVGQLDDSWWNDQQENGGVTSLDTSQAKLREIRRRAGKSQGIIVSKKKRARGRSAEVGEMRTYTRRRQRRRLLFPATQPLPSPLSNGPVDEAGRHSQPQGWGSD